MAPHVGHTALSAVAGSVTVDWYDDALADRKGFAAFPRGSPRQSWLPPLLVPSSRECSPVIQSLVAPPLQDMRNIPLQRKGRVSHGHALMNAPSRVPPTIGGTPAKRSNVNFGQRIYGHSTTDALASVTAASGVHVVLKTFAA